MLDTNDNILFPLVTATEDGFEPIDEPENLDEMEAPEGLQDEQAIEDDSLCIEYDETLCDDSDDFREEE